jgi:hypothetical protein
VEEGCGLRLYGEQHMAKVPFDTELRVFDMLDDGMMHLH